MEIGVKVGEEEADLNHSIPLFVGILVLWVFEVQLLMQIIINRIAVVVDDRKMVRRLKVCYSSPKFSYEHDD